MKINELINELEKLRYDVGNVDVDICLDVCDGEFTYIYEIEEISVDVNGFTNDKRALLTVSSDC